MELIIRMKEKFSKIMDEIIEVSGRIYDYKARQEFKERKCSYIWLKLTH